MPTRSPLSLADEHLGDGGRPEGLGHSVHDPAQRLVHRELHRLGRGALAGGAFIGSAGDGKIASAPRVDYAEAAVAVLTGEGHEGKTYELAGDEAYTLSDLAAEISRQTGKDNPLQEPARGGLRQGSRRLRPA